MMMPSDPQTLWTLPVPSTALERGPELIIRAREHQLVMQRECGDETRTLSLSCHEVVAFRCVHMHGLSAEMITSAYDRLIDLGETGWLIEIRTNAVANRVSKALRHLRICFDDGPCYEWICEGFSVEDDPRFEDAKREMIEGFDKMRLRTANERLSRDDLHSRRSGLNDKGPAEAGPLH